MNGWMDGIQNGSQGLRALFSTPVMMKFLGEMELVWGRQAKPYGHVKVCPGGETNAVVCIAAEKVLQRGKHTSAHQSQ